MNIVPLAAGELYRLAELGTTPDPDRWVAEVESFLFVSVPAQRGAALGSRAVLVTDDDGHVIAAAAHKPHPRYDAELLQALVIGVHKRRRGNAEPALRSMLDYLHSAVGARHVMWLVHHSNLPMLEVSGRVVAPAATDDDLVVFVEP